MIAEFEVVLSLSMLQKKYFVFEQIVLFLYIFAVRIEQIRWRNPKIHFSE